MTELTIQMSRALLPEFSTLSAERIWTEFSKWARGPHPAMGLNVLVQTGWIAAFPELAALRGVPQDARWHPEGDVWTHTLLSVDQAALIARREGLDGEQTETLVLAALTHDIGKYRTTQKLDGRIISYGHAELGAEMASAFLRRMRAPDDVAARVSILVGEHMVHASAQPTPAAVRRLAGRLAASHKAEERVTVRLLALLAEADASGRFPAPPVSPMAEWVEVAAQLHLLLNRPEPILKGRHLMAAPFNMAAGPALGPILRAAFEAQLDGAFSDADGALVWAADRVKAPVG